MCPRFVCISPMIFQSTLLQEERLPYQRGSRSQVENFNPRSYKRSDRQEVQQSKGLKYFNPRSYKRSDNTSFKKLINSTISIHAPTRGATASVFLASSIRSLFQSTLLQEERLPSRIARTISMLFQSTLLQEERRSVPR